MVNLGDSNAFAENKGFQNTNFSVQFAEFKGNQIYRVLCSVGINLKGRSRVAERRRDRNLEGVMGRGREGRGTPVLSDRMQSQGLHQILETMHKIGTVNRRPSIGNV